MIETPVWICLLSSLVFVVHGIPQNDDLTEILNVIKSIEGENRVTSVEVSSLRDAITGDNTQFFVAELNPQSGLNGRAIEIHKINPPTFEQTSSMRSNTQGQGQEDNKSFNSDDYSMTFDNDRESFNETDSKQSQERNKNGRPRRPPQYPGYWGYGRRPPSGRYRGYSPSNTGRHFDEPPNRRNWYPPPPRPPYHHDYYNHRPPPPPYYPPHHHHHYGGPPYHREPPHGDSPHYGGHYDRPDRPSKPDGGRPGEHGNKKPGNPIIINNYNYDPSDNKPSNEKKSSTENSLSQQIMEIFGTPNKTKVEDYPDLDIRIKDKDPAAAGTPLTLGNGNGVVSHGEHTIPPFQAIPVTPQE